VNVLDGHALHAAEDHEGRRPTSRDVVGAHHDIQQVGRPARPGDDQLDELAIESRVQRQAQPG
jgi:hypothetical protein